MTGQITEHWVFVGDQRIFRGWQVSLHVEAEIAARIEAAAKAADIADVVYIVRAIRAALDRDAPTKPGDAAAAGTMPIPAAIETTSSTAIGLHIDAILGPSAA